MRDPDLVHRRCTPKVVEVRSLTLQDLEVLRLPRASVGIKRLRARHHQMAWLTALGKRNTDICAECDITPNRLSRLQRAPAFIEAVAVYTREIQEARLETCRNYGTLAAENMQTVEELIAKELSAVVEGNAPTPSLRDLNRLSMDRADRFGYGKHTTSESRNINVNFASKLESAIARSRRVA